MDEKVNKAPKREDERKQDRVDPQPGVDPNSIDPAKTPGSGMFPDSGGEAPSG